MNTEQDLPHHWDLETILDHGRGNWERLLEATCPSCNSEKQFKIGFARCRCFKCGFNETSIGTYCLQNSVAIEDFIVAAGLEFNVPKRDEAEKTLSLQSTPKKASTSSACDREVTGTPAVSLRPASGTDGTDGADAIISETIDFGDLFTTFQPRTIFKEGALSKDSIERVLGELRTQARYQIQSSGNEFKPFGTPITGHFSDTILKCYCYRTGLREGPLLALGMRPVVCSSEPSEWSSLRYHCDYDVARNKKFPRQQTIGQFTYLVVDVTGPHGVENQFVTSPSGRIAVPSEGDGDPNKTHASRRTHTGLHRVGMTASCSCEELKDSSEIEMMEGLSDLAIRLQVDPDVRAFTLPFGTACLLPLYFVDLLEGKTFTRYCDADRAGIDFGVKQLELIAEYFRMKDIPRHKRPRLQFCIPLLEYSEKKGKDLKDFVVELQKNGHSNEQINKQLKSMCRAYSEPADVLDFVHDEMDVKDYAFFQANQANEADRRTIKANSTNREGARYHRSSMFNTCVNKISEAVWHVVLLNVETRFKLKKRKHTKYDYEAEPEIEFWISVARLLPDHVSQPPKAEQDLIQVTMEQWTSICRVAGFREPLLELGNQLAGMQFVVPNRTDSIGSKVAEKLGEITDVFTPKFKNRVHSKFRDHFESQLNQLPIGFHESLLVEDKAAHVDRLYWWTNQDREIEVGNATEKAKRKEERAAKRIEFKAKQEAKQNEIDDLYDRELTLREQGQIDGW